MSDWAVGDLAVCVDARPNPVWGETGLTEGRAYTIAALTGVIINHLYQTKMPGAILREVPCSSPHGFGLARFRKVRPDKHEKCEDEFVELLKRSKVNA